MFYLKLAIAGLLLAACRIPNGDYKIEVTQKHRDSVPEAKASKGFTREVEQEPNLYTSWFKYYPNSENCNRLIFGTKEHRQYFGNGKINVRILREVDGITTVILNTETTSKEITYQTAIHGKYQIELSADDTDCKKFFRFDFFQNDVPDQKSLHAKNECPQ